MFAILATNKRRDGKTDEWPQVKALCLRPVYRLVLKLD